MRKKIKIFLISTILFLIGFIILEIIVDVYIHYFADEEFLTQYASLRQLVKRFQRDKSKSRLSPHPYTGYTLSPGYEKDCNKHNSYGFRGEELEEKKDGEIWIVCLGESTTYDYHIKCWEKAYPAQLERYLNEKGVKVKVINAGVDGWTSFEVLIDFALRITRFPVDILIYYGGFNDIIFTRMVYPLPDNVWERDITYARSGAIGMLNYPFWENSSVIRMILIKAGLTFPHFDLFVLNPSPGNRFPEFIVQLLKANYPSGIYREIPVERILTTNSPIWFRQNLENLVCLAKSKSITPVLISYVLNESTEKESFIVSQAEAVRIFKQVIKPAVDEMNGVMGDVSKKYEIPYLDLADEYPIDGGLFADLIHNNEQGAIKKAEIIGEFLINTGIVGGYRNLNE